MCIFIFVHILPDGESCVAMYYRCALMDSIGARNCWAGGMQTVRRHISTYFIYVAQWGSNMDSQFGSLWEEDPLESFYGNPKLLIVASWFGDQYVP